MAGGRRRWFWFIYHSKVEEEEEGDSEGDDSSPGRPTRAYDAPRPRNIWLEGFEKRASQQGRILTTKRFTTDARSLWERDLLVREKIYRAFRWRWINEWLRHLRTGRRALTRAERGGTIKGNLKRLQSGKCVRTYRQRP